MKRVRLLLGLSLVTVLTLLMGCGPAPTPGVIEKMVEVEVTRVVEKEGETVVETVIEEVVVTAEPEAEAEEITLRVWDQFGGSAATPVDLIYANFMIENPNITITFNRAYDQSTLTTDTFRLEYRNAAGSWEAVPGNIQPLGTKKAEFKPTAVLMDGVRYRVTVVAGENGVKGKGGGERERNDPVTEVGHAPLLRSPPASS